MAHDQIFLSAQITDEMDADLREIAAKLRWSRSKVARIAIHEYIQRYRVVGVSQLPGPEGAERPLLITVENKNE